MPHRQKLWLWLARPACHLLGKAKSCVNVGYCFAGSRNVGQKDEENSWDTERRSERQMLHIEVSPWWPVTPTCRMGDTTLKAMNVWYLLTISTLACCVWRSKQLDHSRTISIKGEAKAWHLFPGLTKCRMENTTFNALNSRRLLSLTENTSFKKKKNFKIL